MCVCVCVWPSLSGTLRRFCRPFFRPQLCHRTMQLTSLRPRLRGNRVYQKDSTIWVKAALTAVSCAHLSETPGFVQPARPAQRLPRIWGHRFSRRRSCGSDKNSTRGRPRDHHLQFCVSGQPLRISHVTGCCFECSSYQGAW